MTSQEAAAIIRAINFMQPYVPPMLFSNVLPPELGAVLSAVAREEVVCVASCKGAAAPNEAK